MLVRHRPDRDRHEAGESSFRRQRVVVRIVEAPVGDAEANREQLPLGIEEESKLGLFDEVVSQRAEALAALDQLLGKLSRSLDGLPRVDSTPAR